MVFYSFEFPEESNLFFCPGFGIGYAICFYNIPFKLKWEKRVRVVGGSVYSTITLPVAVDGEAYLFTAPSGTGKSTHTRLWRERFGERAVMINDDKPLIRMEEGTFYVYGTPWNGKHHLSVNQKAPIKAICLLERGKTNHAQQISPAEAYPGLYRQIYRPQNDRGKMLKTLQLLHKMAESIPLYRLQCDISQDAVRASWDAFHSQTDRRQDE